MSTPLIYQKLADINKEISAIGKNQRNQQQNFTYRGIDDVMNELHEYFATHEVIILPQIVNGIREERTSKSGSLLLTSINDYKFTFVATDGSECSALVRGEAMDSGDKSSNKSIAIALKYALTLMFLIPTSEPKDPDAETYQVNGAKKPEQKKPEAKSPFVSAKERVEGTEGNEALTALEKQIKESTKLTGKEKTELITLINKKIK